MGNYDLMEELGRGGMGVVYKAVQRVAEREVAVKLILGGAASGQENRERFQSEVQVLARLRHPNIVPVFEVGVEEDCPFFSMEYMPGGSLAKADPLKPGRAAAIVEQLAVAVEAAHQVGVLHRDIKPGNVLLDAEGTPKLTDFGLAKRMDRDDGLTHTGSVLGTPGYMPPEQARGSRELTPAADVYSLGATLYALLVGRPPFAGRDFQDTLQRVLHDEPPRLRTLRPDLPADLEAVCLKCLEKEPARRYATAQALADDLARWQSGNSTLARPQTIAQRTARQMRRHWRPIALATALLAVVIGTVLVIRSRDPLLKLEAELRRDRPVTLIAAGMPSWFQWPAGGGSLNEAGGKGMFVECTGSGLLELAPATHHPHFRLTAEYQHDGANNSDSRAGLFFARSAEGRNDFGAVGRVVVAAYRDDLVKHRPAFSRGDIVGISDELVVSTKQVPLQLWGAPVGEIWIQEEKPVQRPWRRISIEVVAEGVFVRFWPDLDLMGPPLIAQPTPIRLSTLERRTGVHREWLGKNFPQLEALPIEFEPQGGCGLFIRNARVYFRNVMFEPLP